VGVGPMCAGDPEVGMHMCAPTHRINVHGGTGEGIKGAHYVRTCRLHSCAFVRGCDVDRRACVCNRRAWERAYEANRCAYVRAYVVNRHACVCAYGLKNSRLRGKFDGCKIDFCDVVDGLVG
jgi:hypothetical protein